MIKVSIQEDITIINIYAPNIGALQYVRQILTCMKGETNNNTTIVGDFNTPLTPMDRSTKHKISKETQTKETIAKINKAKSWFFERINKIDKPLARLIEKQRDTHKTENEGLEKGISCKWRPKESRTSNTHIK